MTKMKVEELQIKSIHYEMDDDGKYPQGKWTIGFKVIIKVIAGITTVISLIASIITICQYLSNI